MCFMYTLGTVQFFIFAFLAVLPYLDLADQLGIILRICGHLLALAFPCLLMAGNPHTIRALKQLYQRKTSTTTVSRDLDQTAERL